MHINLHTQLTADDYGNAMILHMSKRQQFFIFLYMAIIILSIMALLAFCQSPGSENHLILLAIAATVLGIAWWTVYIQLPTHLKKRAAKLFQQQTSLQKPRDIELTDELCHTRWEQGETKQPWNEFHKWKYNEKLILVYSSDMLMSMFPRHLFAFDADYQSFKDVLRREIGEPGKPRKRIQ